MDKISVEAVANAVSKNTGIRIVARNWFVDDGENICAACAIGHLLIDKMGLEAIKQARLNDMMGKGIGMIQLASEQLDIPTEYIRDFIRAFDDPHRNWDGDSTALADGIAVSMSFSLRGIGIPNVEDMDEEQDTDSSDTNI